MDSEEEPDEASEGSLETLLGSQEPIDVVAGPEFEASSSDSFEVERDLYNFSLSVEVVDTESEEVDAEFMGTINEIEGNKLFPCSKCEKVCKPKGGLTRHTNFKHWSGITTSANTATGLSEEDLAGIVEGIKTSLVEGNLFGPDINAAIKEVSSTKALFNDISPIYNTFCTKRNQDKMLVDFYGLLPISPNKCEYAL